MLRRRGVRSGRRRIHGVCSAQSVDHRAALEASSASIPTMEGRFGSGKSGEPLFCGVWSEDEIRSVAEIGERDLQTG